MKIELNAGGFGGGATIRGFQSDFSTFITKSEKVIASFKAVKQQVYNTSGGVGNLNSGLNNLQSRISREERKKERLQTAQRQASDFVDLAVRVDKKVATLVNKNKEQFYQKYPHLKPVKTSQEKAWYEKAWDWICDKSEALVNGIKKGFEDFIENAKGALKWLCQKGGQFAKLVIESHILAWKLVIDGAQKLWNGVVAFYQEHKEIIHKIVGTVLIVVAAVAAIAAVVVTGGAALAPILTAIGLSASTALTISGVVAVTAVVTTAASAVMNVLDLWMEIDNPVFNFFQGTFNVVSAITNFTYSIGSIYNQIMKIDLKRGFEIGKLAKTNNADDMAKAMQLTVQDGKTNQWYLRNLVDDMAELDFKTTETIAKGFKFEKVVDGKRALVYWHSADAAAPVTPGAYGGASGWSAHIQLGTKKLSRLLDDAGQYIWKNRANLPEVHIEVTGIMKWWPK